VICTVLKHGIGKPVGYISSFLTLSMLEIALRPLAVFSYDAGSYRHFKFGMIFIEK
jgi:hypothetical protein